MTLTNLREKSAGQILRALLTAFSAAFLIAAVCAPDRAEIFTGFVRIISKPGQLTKDYFCSEIGRFYLQENGPPGSDLGWQDRAEDQSQHPGRPFFPGSEENICNLRNQR